MNVNTNALLRATVRAILHQPFAYEWSLQGFGMLRCYLSPTVRMHIWNSEFKVPHVSTVHDHPWDFTSYIVAGRVSQYRFTECVTDGEPFLRSTIRCGVGGGLVRAECSMAPAEEVLLRRSVREVYSHGEWYSQRADEIHESIPDDGTVTLVERRFKEDTEHARVYYQTPEWVSAEPRRATEAEVRHAIERAVFQMEAGS